MATDNWMSTTWVPHQGDSGQKAPWRSAFAETFAPLIRLFPRKVPFYHPLSGFPIRSTKTPSSGEVYIVDYQKLSSIDSDFARHPGDGKHSWLGVLLLLAVWSILLLGGWRTYVYILASFALFMTWLNRRELRGRISTAARKWRAILIKFFKG